MRTTSRTRACENLCGVFSCGYMATCRCREQDPSSTLRMVVLAQPWLSRRSTTLRSARLQPIALFESMGNSTSAGMGDSSKCPFTGGDNGGGLGDANILTFTVFIAVVLVMRWLLRRIFVILKAKLLYGSALSL